ncbi:hypothetical protein Rhe02_80790 [Rhizocola hellebori]|uniref:Uncharacterized protein n=1 Tax=Rhizocola hellebori TaxID=1392758 RepID=A0A8J3QI02_9ACTN|nr:hypothetical protein [Rhizocola hellebori]GIH10012.1 hypothetical protein Rhe02_80790 [Rhizocola hellebori]
MIRFVDLSNADVDGLFQLSDQWRREAATDRRHSDALRDIWDGLPHAWQGDAADVAIAKLAELTDSVERSAQEAERTADALRNFGQELGAAQRALRDAVDSAHRQGLDVVLGHVIAPETDPEQGQDKRALVPPAQRAIDHALELAQQADLTAAAALGLLSALHRAGVTPDVMDLLERSFTPAEIATMEPGRLRSILDVGRRMHDAGIDLSRVQRIKSSWNANTDGIELELREPLNLDPAVFVEDTGAFGYDFQHFFGGQEAFPPEHTVAHREISKDGTSPALHVLQRDNGVAQVHIDFVPVAEGRDDDGTPNHIITNVPEHIIKDLTGVSHDDDVFDRYNKLDHPVPKIEEKLRELAWQGGQDTPEARRLTAEIEQLLEQER